MTDYIVKDIALADFGRKEMPSLIALHKEYGESKPFKGARCGIATYDDPDGCFN